MTESETRTGHPILVVEDEDSIRRGLCDVLAYHGHAPHAVARGDEGLAAAREARFALLLLDVMLPGMSGFDVCQQLRAEQATLPILMLTARGSEEDVLQGFRCGADDYVTKPFSVAELMARVDALLRRSGVADPARDAERFRIGPFEVDPGAGVARTDPDGDAIALTAREIAILRLLADEPGRIVSRRRLLAEVWGYPQPERVETRTVDMHIVKLRRKLARAPETLIETVRGEGYRYPG